MKKLVCFCLYLITVPLMAQPGSDADRLFSEAKTLQANYRDGEAMVKYEELVSAHPDYYPALYELVVIKSRIADRTPDEAKKMNYYHQAKDYAMKAYALQPNTARSNYLMALGAGGVALVSSYRQSLAYAFEMKRYLDAALKLDPHHADSWHLLGRWHFKMANLSFPEVLVANLFFKGVPKGASNDMAINSLQKAVECNPASIIYYYDLARAYQSLKKERDAKETLEAALQLPITTTDQQEIQRRCRYLMKKYEEW